MRRGCSKGHYQFVEDNMSREVNARGLQIEALIGTLGGRVADKHTWTRLGLKFVRCVGLQPWEAKAPKDL